MDANLTKKIERLFSNLDPNVSNNILQIMFLLEAYDEYDIITDITSDKISLIEFISRLRERIDETDDEFYDFIEDAYNNILDYEEIFDGVWDNQKYQIIEDDEKAKLFAINVVQNDLDSYLSKEKMKDFLVLTDTTINIISSEAASLYVGDMSDLDVLDILGVDEDYDINTAREEVEETYKKALEFRLKEDPIGYFKELGFDLDSMMKFFVINPKGAAKNVVDTGGADTVLDNYDGDMEEMNNYTLLIPHDYGYIFNHKRI